METGEWLLAFNYSTNHQGGGTGVVLHNPDGTIVCLSSSSSSTLPMIKLNMGLRSHSSSLPYRWRLIDSGARRFEAHYPTG